MIWLFEKKIWLIIAKLDQFKNLKANLIYKDWLSLELRIKTKKLIIKKKKY